MKYGELRFRSCDRECGCNNLQHGGRAYERGSIATESAVLAFNHLVGFGDIQVAAAHFAFENSHNISPVYLFSLQSLFLSARIASAFLQSGTTLVSSLSTIARWSSSITALSSVSAATVASFETGSQ